MKKLIIALIFLLITLSKVSFSQADSIIIKIKNASVNVIDTSYNSSDSILLQIDFYVSSIENIQSLTLLAGRAPMNNKVMQSNLTVNEYKNKFFYYLSNKNNIIKNWEGNSIVLEKIKKDMIEHLKWITLYGKDKNGNTLKAVYFEFK